jgi:hypothetical protein
MKAISFGLLLAVSQMLAAAVWADDIKESDYPIHYEVVNTDKTDKFVVQKICSMTLRDESDVNVLFTVSKTGIGACHVLDSGKVYNGRRNEKKNEIELVIPVGEDKARVETWQINSIVHTNPS